VDWIDEAEREVVERILVLLALFSGCFGQAGPAGEAGGGDRLASLPLLMRLAILLALARAEAAAQSYLAGLPPAALAGLVPEVTALDAGADAGSWAERLAARLLALAAVLTLVLARAWQEAPTRVHAAGRRALRAIAPAFRTAATLRGLVPTPAPDTS
jgi:hypothetical protein